MLLRECPKCAAVRQALDPKTAAWCPICHRWQFLSELEFEEFLGGRFRHLGCVGCHRGAWCRDLWTRPDAAGCARESHVEAFDEHTTAGLFKPKDPRR
jgi:hypothetical protein